MKANKYLKIFYYLYCIEPKEAIFFNGFYDNSVIYTLENGFSYKEEKLLKEDEKEEFNKINKKINDSFNVRVVNAWEWPNDSDYIMVSALYENEDIIRLVIPKTFVEV